MAKLVECIPNFSLSKEKNEAGYNALIEVAKSVPGCILFDAQTDGNHNRSVFTLLGSPEAVEEVAFRLAKKAMELIDMNRHVGEHSRMGATDVIPFVNVGGTEDPVLPVRGFRNGAGAQEPGDLQKGTVRRHAREAAAA